MNREQAEMLLAQLIFDELEDPAKSELLEYLKHDAQLNERLGDMRLTVKLLRESVDVGEKPQLSAKRKAKLLKKLASKPTKPKKRKVRTAGPVIFTMRKLAAVAACLALGVILVGIFLPALGAARRSARQMQTNTQLRGMHQGMVMYAQKNKGQYPSDLSALVEENYLTPEYLISPQDSTKEPTNFDKMTSQEKKQWVHEKGSYVAIALGDKETLDAEKVVGFEKFGEDKGGVAVVFDDNHVQYMHIDSARELIERQTGQSVEQVTQQFVDAGRAPASMAANLSAGTTHLPEAAQPLRPLRPGLAKPGRSAAQARVDGAKGMANANTESYKSATVVAGADVVNDKRGLMRGKRLAKRVGPIVTGKMVNEDDAFKDAAPTLQQRPTALVGQHKNAPSFDLSEALSNTSSGGSGGGGSGDLFANADGDTKQQPVVLQEWGMQIQQGEELDKHRAAMGGQKKDVRQLLERAEAEARAKAEAAEQAAAEAAPPPKPRIMPVNPWVMTRRDRFSTFATDVDTASYAIARRYISQGQLPPIATVRMEEFVNSFDYNYPTGKRASSVFTTHAAAAPSPFGGNDLTLVKIGIRGRVVGRDQLKPAHLVFVVDASGSMDKTDRLPLVQHSLALLLDQLAEHDMVSLVSYDTKANLLLEAVPAKNKQQILNAINAIQCRGSTNLIDGLRLGYEIAQKHYYSGGVNRVILCSDGVANVGLTDARQMLSDVEIFREHGISFNSVGFGAGSYDDRLLEQLADHGDGSYFFVGSPNEAKRLFVEDCAATLPTIAKNVKIQVEFNPQRVRRYRLIGYENRDIADRDFRNDTIDAGEVGSGQSATALYEVELLGPAFGPLATADLGSVFVRYENAASGRVEEISTRLGSDIIQRRTVQSDPRFFLAASAARFAEILRESEHVGDGNPRNLAAVQSVLEQVCNMLPLERSVVELFELVRRAEGLSRATTN